VNLAHDAQADGLVSGRRRGVHCVGRLELAQVELPGLLEAFA